jgi:biopolymer transport protein ExbD
MFGMHRHRQQTDNVEPDLPITPMLDMTFQLLAFFVFTFKPQKAEAQIAFSLPSGSGITGIPDVPNLDKPIVLVLEVRSNDAGNIASMRLRVEDRNFGALPGRSVELGSDLDLLKRELAANHEHFKSQKLTVKLQLEVSENLAWAHAVRITDLGKQIGFRDIAPTLLKE